MKTNFIQKITDKVIPIFIYIIDQDILTDIDIEELRFFSFLLPPNETYFYFIRIESI